MKKVALEKYDASHADRIPSPDGIDSQKLEDGGCMSDNCNLAQSMQTKLIATINGRVYQMHCFEHMFNTLLNGVNKRMTAGLRVMVSDSADVDSTLRFTTSPVLMFRAAEKDLAPTCNYVKGHGLDSNAWLRDYIKNECPDLKLRHIERTLGSRFYIICTAAVPIMFNRETYLNYLDDRLGDRQTDDSCLQLSLWGMIGSLQMAAMTRLLSILYLSSVFPFQWLVGKLLTLTDDYPFKLTHAAHAVSFREDS